MGGKAKISNKLLPHLRNDYGTYFEPFFGGGTMLWKLQPRRAIINDINGYLMLIYACIQHDCEKFIQTLVKLAEDEKLLVHSKDKSEIKNQMRSKFSKLLATFNAEKVNFCVPHKVAEIFTQYPLKCCSKLPTDAQNCNI